MEDEKLTLSLFSFLIIIITYWLNRSMLLFRYVYFLFVFVVLKCVYAVSSPPPEAPIQCFRNACDDSVNQDCCVPTPAEASSGELDEPARCKNGLFALHGRQL